MAPHPRRARLLVAVAAAVLAVGAIIAITRGGSGHKPSVKSGSAAGTADSWAQQTAGQGPGRFALPADLPASLGLRMKKGGPPVTVTGTVRLAPGGTPVADAEVAFMSDLGENTAISDGSGRYTIKIASGIRWKVHARSEKAVGYPEAIEPAADVVRDLEIHPTAAIKGKVVDARGAAAPGANVSIEVDAADRGLLEAALGMSAVADAGGRFELTAVPGNLKVRGAQGLAQGVVTLAAVAPGDTVEVAITLADPVTLKGRVVDGDGQPVGGAKVLTATILAVGGPVEKQQFDSADDGSFTARTPAGIVRIEARKNGDLSPAVAEPRAGGATIDGLVLTLAAPIALRGKVITDDGTPVIGAKVRLAANSIYDTTTGSDGTFEVGAPGGQAYTVKVRHSDGQVDRVIAAWNGDETFVMRRFGTLQLTVPDQRGEVTAVIDSFLPAGEQAPRAPAEARFRGVGGQLTLSRLEPGVYDLTVATVGAGATRVPRVAIADGETRALTVALAAPVPVRGVVKAGAQPIGGAQVTIGGRTTFSDAKGRWIIADVAAGPIAIVAIKAGFGTAYAGAVAAADARPVELELRPSDGAGVVDGVGVVVGPAAKGAVVQSVLPGSPAEGKLAPGDVIAEVDGTDVAAAAMDDIIARLRGSAGSTVSITVQRGADTSTVDVVRKRLVVPPGSGPVAIAAIGAVGGAGC